MQRTEAKRTYGEDDASFLAAGGEAGIRRLVDDFYDIMSVRPGAARIRAMHPDDLAGSRDRLAAFLCGWLGGPRRYAERYGPISIPGAHSRFDIGPGERDAWLDCMREAVVGQPYADDFKVYLLTQLAVPAERIRQACLAANREA